MPRAARIHLRWMTATRSRHGQQRPSRGDGRARASARSPRFAAISRRAVSGASLSRRATKAKPPPPPPPSSSISVPTTCRATSACSIFCLRQSPSRRGSTCAAFSNRSVHRSRALYDADPVQRAMLVEDVGELSLARRRPPPRRRCRRFVPARSDRAAPDSRRRHRANRLSMYRARDFLHAASSSNGR